MKVSTRLRTSIARLIAGSNWGTGDDSSGRSTFGGSLNADFMDMHAAFFAVGTERVEIYEELELLDDGSIEMSKAMDILSDEAVHSEDAKEETFEITGKKGAALPSGLASLLENCRQRIQADLLVMLWARDTLKYGDTFLQIVINQDRVTHESQVGRVVAMPVKQMHRHEDNKGRLIWGNQLDKCAYSQVDGLTFLAGFYPWQIAHLRWQPSTASKYGRGLGYTARIDWRKLRAMEEALVINWLTRAFARLLFTIDVTGLDPEAADKYVEQFKKKFLSRRGTEGDVVKNASTVVKDIFVGNGWIDFGAKQQKGLTGVEVLDMSNTGFWSLNPLRYYQRKILTATQVPPAYLALEDQVNAKATLTEEARRFARAVTRVQQVLTGAFTQIFNIELVLHGYDPRKDLYEITWPNPSKLDEKEAADIALTQAKADKVYYDVGAIDSQWISQARFDMSETDATKVLNRVKTQAKKEVAKNAEGV